MSNTLEPGDALQHGRDYKVVHVDDARALIFLTGNHRILEVDAATGGRLERGLDNLTPEEAREWSLLRERGALEDVNRNVLMSSSYEDGSNLALNVNLTGSCNLDCTYCFADGGDYGRITDKMGSHTVDYIFDFIRGHVTRSRIVRFEFFGGEPLLNFARIQQICERSDEFSAETGIQFIHRISTNLTVLPKGAPELMRDRHFIVSVSIDGGAETHDRNRPTKAGGGSFDKILANCWKVREVGGDTVTMVARMTVVSSQPPLIDNVKELWGLNLFDYFQIYPGVTSGGSCNGGEGLVQLGTKNTTKQTMNIDFLSQLEVLLAEYPNLFQPGNRFKGGLEYERLMQMVLEGKMALGFCGAGKTYYTISPDDSIMACHRMVGEVEYQIGTGPEGVTRDTSEWTLPVDQHPVCSNCWARYVCGGNCRQENFVATGKLRALNEETCNYQLSLLAGVLRLIGRTDPSFRSRDRHRLDDLFVSCGRPVVPNSRREREAALDGLRFFRPLPAALDAGAQNLLG
ncbi:MAG TPA: radical SAM protein [Thermoanaerobaculia bacterium]|nr:radical SAM protein [Thermoanaerobaculia bacterium]